MPKKTSTWQGGKHTLNLGDGLLRQVYSHAHEPGRLIAHNEQPDKGIILERNQRLRNDPGSVKDLSFGRLALTIPLDDYYDLRKKYPELRSRDAKVRTRCWQKLMNTPEFAQFRVRERV